MRTGADQSASGLGALGAERFDAVSAVGGWRGVLESAVPILVFVVILAVAPTALTTALVASLTVSGVALLARLAQRGRRRNLKQVAGGALVTVLSAAWAWRSGQASNFYATGLVINAVCLLAFLGSLLLRRPLIGVLMELWHPTSGGDAESPESPEDPESPESPEDPESPASGSSWRTDPARAGIRRRYAIATGVLAAVFVLRLLVEVPLYLAGEAALGALGVSRVVLGLPLYGLGIWFAWLIVRPSSQRAIAERSGTLSTCRPAERGSA